MSKNLQPENFGDEDKLEELRLGSYSWEFQTYPSSEDEKLKEAGAILITKSIPTETVTVWSKDTTSSVSKAVVLPSVGSIFHRAQTGIFSGQEPCPPEEQPRETWVGEARDFLR